MTSTERRPSLMQERWSIAAESAAAGVLAYLGAAASEFGLIRLFRPSERELEWVSDVVLSAAFGVAVYLWRHLSATRRDLAARERAELVLNTQLAVAADMQRRLLPSLPPRGSGVDFAALLRPAGQIGGDFYDVVTLGPGRWLAIVADVSGKGIPAAMALSSLRAAFRALATDTRSPADLLTGLSATLYEQWAGAPYVTGIVARIDRRAGRLTYANAGHPPGVLAGPGGVRLLESNGPPAALLPGVGYGERVVPIHAGDTCILVSDGVTEALGDGKPVTEMIAGAAARTCPTAGAVCDAVMARSLQGHGPPGVTDWQDDRTVFVAVMVEDGSTGSAALLVDLAV